MKFHSLKIIFIHFLFRVCVIVICTEAGGHFWVLVLRSHLAWFLTKGQNLGPGTWQFRDPPVCLQFWDYKFVLLYLAFYFYYYFK